MSRPAVAWIPSAATDETVQGRLKAIVDAHYDLLWRTLRRLGVGAGAIDDAAQQVLIIVARRLSDIESGKERAFVLGTAVRVAADYRKRSARAREQLMDDMSAQPSWHAPSTEELLDAQRARALLDVVLATLPDDLRAIFVLYEVEELTMAAIAELLQLPAGTVASRLRRARELFELAASRLRAGRSV